MEQYSNSTTDIDNDIAKIEALLRYVIPILCTTLIPFTFLNIYIILQNAHKRASHFIYFNLLLTDILAICGGISLVIHAVYEDASGHAKWVFNNMQWMAFYCGLCLLFGLALVRILTLKLEAATVDRRMVHIAKVLVMIAWIIALFISTLHDSIDFSGGPQYPWLPFGKDVAVIVIVTPTALMNLYICIKVRTSRQFLGDAFARASITTILLFCNFLMCYGFFLGCYVLFVYNVLSGTKYCPTASMIGVIFCTNEGRHYVGMMLMLLQSLVNNVILISQKETKHILGIVGRYYYHKVRNAMKSSNTNEGYTHITGNRAAGMGGNVKNKGNFGAEQEILKKNSETSFDPPGETSLMSGSSVKNYNTV